MEPVSARIGAPLAVEFHACRAYSGDPMYHPLSHVRTSTDLLADFDGLDDPHRQMDWPFSMKVFHNRSTWDYDHGKHMG